MLFFIAGSITVMLIPPMKPFLYHQLLVSLLLELTNEGYQHGQRFLSRRAVCQRWAISTPTAERALATLAEAGILEARPRSGFHIRQGFRRRTLRYLNEVSTLPGLPARTTFSQRYRVLFSTGVGQEQRLAVIFDGYQYDHLHIAHRPDFLEACSLACARGAIAEAGAAFDLHFYALNQIDSLPLDQLRQHLAKGGYCGVILFQRNAKRKGAQTLINAISKEGLPVVCAFSPSERSHAIALDFNHLGIGYRAGRRLLEQGCRRIGVAVINGWGHHLVRHVFDRLNGVQLAVQQAGGNVRMVPLRLEVNGEFTQETLRPHLSGRNRLDAIFFPGHHHSVALGELVRELRLCIPEDLSMIMTSSQSYSEGLGREIDLMKIDFEAIGARSVALMRQMLTRAGALPRLTLVDLEYEDHGSIR